MQNFSTGPVSAIALSPTATHLAAACGQSTLALHTLPPHAPKTPLSHTPLLRPTITHQASSLTALTFPSDSTIYTADSKGSFTRYKTSPTLAPVYTVSAAHAGDDITGIAALSDTSLIATSGRDGTVRCWDPETRVSIAKLTGHRYEARAVAMAASQDAHAPVTILASAGRDKTVRLWDVRASSSSPIHVFTGHSGWVHDVSLLADPPLLVSCAGDKTVRVWDLATMTERHVFKGHEYRVWGVAAASDASFVVSGSTDATLRAWKLRGDDVGLSHVYEGHADSVVAVAVAPSGRFAVTGCEDGTAFTWDCQTLFGKQPLEEPLVELHGVHVRPAVPTVLDPRPLLAEPSEPSSAPSIQNPISISEPLPTPDSFVGTTLQETNSHMTEQLAADNQIRELETMQPLQLPTPPRTPEQPIFEHVSTPVESPSSIPERGPPPPKQSLSADLQAALSVTTEQLPSYDKSAAELVKALQRIRDLEQSLVDAKENDAARLEEINSLTTSLAEREKQIAILDGKLDAAEKLNNAVNVNALLERTPRKADVSLDFQEPVNKIGAVSDQLGALAARLDAMIATN